MTKRFQKMESVSILALSTLLDPRFKDAYFSNPFAKAEVVRKLNKMLSEADSEKDSSDSEAGVASSAGKVLITKIQFKGQLYKASDRKFG